MACKRARLVQRRHRRRHDCSQRRGSARFGSSAPRRSWWRGGLLFLQQLLRRRQQLRTHRLHRRAACQPQLRMGQRCAHVAAHGGRAAAERSVEGGDATALHRRGALHGGHHRRVQCHLVGVRGQQRVDVHGDACKQRKRVGGATRAAAGVRQRGSDEGGAVGGEDDGAFGLGDDVLERGEVAAVGRGRARVAVTPRGEAVRVEQHVCVLDEEQRQLLLVFVGVSAAASQQRRVGQLRATAGGGRLLRRCGGRRRLCRQSRRAAKVDDQLHRVDRSGCGRRALGGQRHQLH